MVPSDIDTVQYEACARNRPADEVETVVVTQGRDYPGAGGAPCLLEVADLCAECRERIAREAGERARDEREEGC